MRICMYSIITLIRISFFPHAFHFDFYRQWKAQFVSAVQKRVTRIYSLGRNLHSSTSSRSQTTAWSTKRANWLFYSEQSLNTIPLYVALYLSIYRFQNNNVTRRHIRLKNLPTSNLKNWSPVPIRSLHAYMHSSYVPKYIAICQHARREKIWISVGKKQCIRVTLVSSVYLSCLICGANHGCCRGFVIRMDGG